MSDGRSTVAGIQQCCWYTWQPGFHDSAESCWRGLNFWTKAFPGGCYFGSSSGPWGVGASSENRAYVAWDRPCIPCQHLVRSSEQVNPWNRGTKVALRRLLGRRSWAEVEPWKFQSCTERCRQLLLFLWRLVWGRSSSDNALAVSKVIFMQFDGKNHLTAASWLLYVHTKCLSSVDQ